jgi:hypothetical protein
MFTLAVVISIIAVTAFGVPLHAQDSTIVVDTLVIDPGAAGVFDQLFAFINRFALPIATIGGSLAIMGLSKMWPGFNAISQNPDGTPNGVGTWAKRGATLLATWVLLMGLRVAGADAPPELVASVGIFWTQLFEALGGAITSGTIWKFATMRPKK